MGGDHVVNAVGQLGYYNFISTGLTFVNDAGDPVPVTVNDAGVFDDAGHQLMFDDAGKHVDDAGNPVGGLREFGGSFWATNATCADYFAFFEVQFLPPDAGADAETTAEAASSDGSTSDGTTVDGATVDGTTVDGTTVDGTTSDGTTVDGATVDGTTVDGATVDAEPADSGTD
jgi:hypothetical protein